MDIVGSFVGGLAVEAFVAAARVMHYKNRWSRHREASVFLRKQFTLSADRIALSLSTRLTRAKLTNAQQSEIAALLRRPEGKALLRQLMLVCLTGQEDQYSVDLVAQFAALVALFTSVPRESADTVGHILHEELTRASHELIPVVADDEDALALFRDEAWNQLLLESLRNISQTTDLYASFSPAQLRSFEEFERAYRTQVRARHKFITPPHLDYVQRVLINKLFVQPNLERIDTSSQDEASGRSTDNQQQILIPPTEPADLSVTLQDLKTRITRAVILGDPGGGKSTLAQKLTYDLSGPGRLADVCPMFVVLRDYAKAESDSGVSVTEFIASRANSQYQVAPPARAVDYLLTSGRALVLFDGLDELLDTSRRQEVVENVESFSNRYPNARVLVTSRRVGYRQAPLDPNVFEGVVLRNFNTDAVKQYSTKWFALDISKTKEQREALAVSFLNESRQIEDVRANPLLLALLCNIYRAENYIPSTRAEVYKSCATMLFEKWDSRRGIRIDLPYRPYLDPAIKHLAYWIYSDEKLQSGITEAQLIDRTAAYLSPSRIEDREEAITVAEAFVAFCKGRAWVFTDTGTTSLGAPLYQFTHRTFLEYFAAAYLVRTASGPADLWNSLKEHIVRQEWDVVSQICIQLQEAQREGAAAEFLTLLLDESSSRSPSDSRSLILYASRSLSFVVPGDSTVRHIVEKCLASSFSFMDTDSESWSVLRWSGELISRLLAVTNDNASAVRRSTIQQLHDGLRSEFPPVSTRSATIALNLPLLLSGGRRSQSVTLTQDWDELQKRFITEERDRLLSLADSSTEVALSLYRARLLSLRRVIDSHGLEIIFEHLFVAGEDNQLTRVMQSAADQFLDSLERLPREPDHTAGWLSDVGELASILREREPPYVQNPVDWYTDYRRSVSTTRRTGRRLPLSPDQLFTAFALRAIGMELEEGKRRSRSFWRHYAAAGSLIGLAGVFAVRAGLESSEAVFTGALARMMQDADLELMRAWAEGRVNLVGGSKLVNVRKDRL